MGEKWVSFTDFQETWLVLLPNIHYSLFCAFLVSRIIVLQSVFAGIAACPDSFWIVNMMI